MTHQIENPSQYQQALDAQDWVLLDFWATWCGPCKSMGPVFDAIAVERADQLFAAKVDVDKYAELAQQFHVRGVPTLALLHRGEAVAQLVGAQPKPAVDKWLKENLDLTVV